MDEQKFVYPWCGLLANVPTEIEKDTGRRTGKSGSILRNDLIQKGFNPTRVQPIWNYKGHSGFALVEFTQDIQGFENAINFERRFRSTNHGKRDWNKSFMLQDDKLYGWVAREDDYEMDGPVGKLLKKRDLKSILQLEDEEKSKMKSLFQSITEWIEKKNICKQEIQEKTNQMSDVLEAEMLHYLQLEQTYQKEVEKIDKVSRNLYQQILDDHKKSMLDIQKKQEELEKRQRNITRNITEAECRKNNNALCLQNEIYVSALKLAEQHQKERGKLQERILVMQKKLNTSQMLELDIENLKGEISVIKLMAGDDAESIEKIAKTQFDLKVRETALNKELMNLTLKERQTSDEYHNCRKEFIRFWNENVDLIKKEKIKTRRMGELNSKPFLALSKHRDLSIVEASVLCSSWQNLIQNTQWHPFKVDDSDGTPKRVVDEKDEELVKLKNDYGEEVYNEVVRARLEIEEYNPSGGYVIQELWNHEENRKATLEEATDVMIRVIQKTKFKSQLADKKNKRRRLYRTKEALIRARDKIREKDKVINQLTTQLMERRLELDKHKVEISSEGSEDENNSVESDHKVGWMQKILGKMSISNA